MFQQNGSHEANAGAKSKKHLGSRSVQELQSELDELFEKEERTGEKADPALILEYVTAIEKKRAEEGSQVQTHDDFETSWAHFTKYHPDLFPPTEPKTRNRGKQVGHFIEAVILAAALLVFTAAAFNWPDHIVEWGRELLRISPAPCGVMELVEPNTDGYSTLAEATAGIGMSEAHTPTWVPARFSLNELTIQEAPSYIIVTAVYASDGSDVVVRITQYFKEEDVPYFNFEKNDDEKQAEVTRNGVTYNYTENFGVLRVTWKDGKCLYNVSGELSREELDQMVNSFYGG